MEALDRFAGGRFALFGSMEQLWLCEPAGTGNTGAMILWRQARPQTMHLSDLHHLRLDYRDKSQFSGGTVRR
jgi:hypothetical protein